MGGAAECLLPSMRAPPALLSLTALHISMPPGPDWKPPKNWNFPWWDYHSGWAHATPKRTVCGVYVTRYSARLLDALVSNYLPHGGWAHCEMFASTVCDLQLTGPGFAGRNCSVGNLRSEALFRNPNFMFGSIFRVGMPALAPPPS